MLFCSLIVHSLNLEDGGERLSYLLIRRICYDICRTIGYGIMYNNIEDR
jgi:hypothetical protein